MISTKQSKTGALYLALSLVLLLYFYFIVIRHLGTPPIKTWDESLFAMRAYYLNEYGKYLQNFDFFPGISDYKNLKPPFGTWLQALSFSIFGYQEWALRLPVVGFVLLTLITIVFLFRTIEASALPAIFSIGILLASPGYIREHVTNTGDHDAIFICFLLLQVYFFFNWTKQDKALYLVGFAISTILGFWVKSIMIFFLFPAYVIYLAVYKMLWKTLFNKWAILALAGIFCFVIGYYWFMDWTSPGFLDMVLKTVWGRYVIKINQNVLPWYYYLWEFVCTGFFPWVMLFIPALVFSKKILTKEEKRFANLMWIIFPSFLLIITLSKTKLFWYDAAVYPFAAILAGLYYNKFLSLKKLKVPAIISLVAFFSYNAHFLIKKNNPPIWQEPEDQFGYFIKTLEKTAPDLKDYVIYPYEFNGQVGYYARLLNDYKNYNIRVMTFWQQENIKAEDKIMICNQEKRDRAEEAYDLEILYEEKTCILARLKVKR